MLEALQAAEDLIVRDGEIIPEDNDDKSARLTTLALIRHAMEAPQPMIGQIIDGYLVLRHVDDDNLYEVVTPDVRWVNDRPTNVYLARIINVPRVFVVQEKGN